MPTELMPDIWARMPRKQEPRWDTLGTGGIFVQVPGIGPVLGQSEKFTLDPFNGLLSSWAI